MPRSKEVKERILEEVVLYRFMYLNPTTEEELKSPLSISNTDWINFTISN